MQPVQLQIDDTLLVACACEATQIRACAITRLVPRYAFPLPLAASVLERLVLACLVAKLAPSGPAQSSAPPASIRAVSARGGVGLAQRHHQLGFTTLCVVMFGVPELWRWRGAAVLAILATLAAAPPSPMPHDHAVCAGQPAAVGGCVRPQRDAAAADCGPRRRQRWRRRSRAEGWSRLWPSGIDDWLQEWARRRPRRRRRWRRRR